MGYYCSVVLVLFLSVIPNVCCDQEDYVTMPQDAQAGQAPYFKETPETTHVALIGEDVKIPCKGYGNPKPFIVWYKNNTLLGNHDHPRIEVKTKSLRIIKAEAADSGVYSCYLFNDHGEKWVNYSLLVANETEMKRYLGVPDNPKYKDLRSQAAKEKLQWDRHLMDFIKGKIGQVTSYIELSCPAKGAPKPTTRWLKDGVPIHHQMSGRISVKRGTLVIADLILKDAGNYTCIVSNIHGSLNWTYELSVLQRAPHVPLFEQPKNQTVRVGETATFSCRIEISDTHPHIQWLKHHQVNGSYTNENGEQYFQIIQGRQRPTINNSNPEMLILHNVTKEDEARYTCLVRNAIGSSFKSAYLEVIDASNSTTPAFTTGAESTSKELTTSTHTSPTVRQDFECHLSYMQVFIPAVLVPNSELTLRDPTCKLNNNGTHHKITFAYDECGTLETFYTDYVDIQNEISVHLILNDTDMITFVEDYKIPLQCSLDRSQMLNIAIQVEPRERIAEQVEHSADFSLKEYSSADYNEEITEYPVKVPLNREIFFEITLRNNSNSSLGVYVERCVATPSPDPNDTTHVALIDVGCSAHPAVKVQPATEVGRFRFSTQAFRFSGQTAIDNLVYIHCSVSTCGGSNCQHPCLPNSRRRRSARKMASVILTSGSHVVTS